MSVLKLGLLNFYVNINFNFPKFKKEPQMKSEPIVEDEGYVPSDKRTGKQLLVKAVKSEEGI